MSGLLWLLVALPGAVGAGLLIAGPPARRIAGWLSVGTVGAVTACAVVAAVDRPASAMPFVMGGSLSLRMDGLAGVAAVTVSVVALLVLVYSVAEIRASRPRFFGLMLVFVAAVLLTVLAGSLPGLLAGWEVMGATSYALIAFEYRDGERVVSGGTAFLTTRTADVGLYLAAGAALAGGSSLDLGALPGLPQPWLGLAAGGVLAAGIGKAAQLPFAFWLSRAMHGPSPVSALLHSAAMVAMGGYLLLRLHPLLVASGWGTTAAAWVGAVTAVVLGAVAVAQSDLKQLLAASTSAQLGYVVLAAGSSTAAGTAQFVAHAATKALLFLAAGAWLAALGSQQLAALTGAARQYRVVGATFAVGGLTLAGVPPLSLWASKDAVLAAARSQSTAVYAVGLAGAALAAAYSGKALGMLLRRPPDGRGGRAVPRLAQLPLVVLAAGAAGLSVLELPPIADALRRAVGGPASHPPPVSEAVLTAALAVTVVALSARLAPALPAPLWLRSWLGLEAVADALVVRPVLRLARALARVDDEVLDRAVLGLAAGTRRVAVLAGRLDDARVDGIVRGLATGARQLGEWARRPQTGLVHQYYMQAMVGLAVAVAILLVVR